MAGREPVFVELVAPVLQLRRRSSEGRGPRATPCSATLLASIHCSAIPSNCAFRRRSPSNAAAFLKILLRSRHHSAWFTSALHLVVESSDRLAQRWATRNWALGAVVCRTTVTQSLNVHLIRLGSRSSVSCWLDALYACSKVLTPPSQR